MTSLQLITEALEEATGRRYISAVTIEPLRVPLYKDVVVSIYEITTSGKILKAGNRAKCRIERDDEKAVIIESLTKQLLVELLQKLLKKN